MATSAGLSDPGHHVAQLSAVDLLRALRQHPVTSATPVMILTNLPQRDQQKLVSEGATMYFERSMLDGRNRQGNRSVSARSCRATGGQARSTRAKLAAFSGELSNF